MNKVLRNTLYLGLSALMVGSLAGAGSSASAATRQVRPRIVRASNGGRDRAVKPSRNRQAKKAKPLSLKQLRQRYQYMIKENRIGHTVVSRLTRAARRNHSKRLAQAIAKDKQIVQMTKLYATIFRNQIKQQTSKKRGQKVHKKSVRKGRKKRAAAKGPKIIKKTRSYVTYKFANHKKVTLLRSRFRRGSYQAAKRAGFAWGPQLTTDPSLFSKYRPNNRRAVVPRRYKIVPNRTVWLVGRRTRSINKINHFKNVYYYNKQFKNWSYIGK